MEGKNNQKRAANRFENFTITTSANRKFCNKRRAFSTKTNLTTTYQHYHYRGCAPIAILLMNGEL